jgi:exo-1,4-beta-D-glucosaminidase
VVRGAPGAGYARRSPGQFAGRLAIEVLAVLAALTGASFAGDESAYAPTAVAAGGGTATAIRHWQMQSSAKAQESGTEISSTGFSTRDWYSVSGRATVMAGLLENGKYDNVFYGDNLLAVGDPDANGTPFVTPWWYRSEFTLAESVPGSRTLLRINGIIPSADVWLNGHLVADHTVVAGAYPIREFDVTPWVQPGSNILGLQVYPAEPRRNLSIGWVDWNPSPPDNNMGPWRGVEVLRTGPVQLRFPQVSSTLSLPDRARAALTATVEARNLDAAPHDVTISGAVANVSLHRTIHLAPGEVQKVSFTSQSDPGLDLKHPKVWWPDPMGAHPLYSMELTATVHGSPSDQVSTAFGIRSVSSHLTKEGYRQFVVNGQPVLIRGAGWAPDMFLRADPERMEAEFSYIANLGLNTVRSEGKLEDQRFYELADRAGVMVLAGWECCDKWESAAKTGGEPWNTTDLRVAESSMASEARLLRNHPSVIGFLIGSDNAPPAALAKLYTDTLRGEGWSLPIIAAAVPQATADTGPSGMKMEGPYAWVPPAYWYADKLGGAFGFNSELSAGASIPRLEDLVRMLAPQELEALWRFPEARQYHASAAWSVFANLPSYGASLAKRYGAPRSLEDYVAKSQLDNYDNVRAQFEAHSAHQDRANPSTGLIYWMLNNAWPSLHWHLYDYFLNPAGAYFGARMANETLHIQYSYDTREIMLVNRTLATENRLRALIRVRNLDGSVAFERRLQGIDLPGNVARAVAVVPALPHLSATYFIELELAAADGRTISRNVYWLATQTDELDWANSNWYLTPVTRYADLTALQTMPTVSSEALATMRVEGGEEVITITLTVPSSSTAVSFFQHLSIKQSGHGEPVVPVLWSDNDITLWPGESRTVSARINAIGATMPVVEVSGWNLPTRIIPITAASGTH